MSSPVRSRPFLPHSASVEAAAGSRRFDPVHRSFLQLFSSIEGRGLCGHDFVVRSCNGFFMPGIQVRKLEDRGSVLVTSMSQCLHRLSAQRRMVQDHLYHNAAEVGVLHFQHIRNIPGEALGRFNTFPKHSNVWKSYLHHDRRLQMIIL